MEPPRVVLPFLDLDVIVDVAIPSQAKTTAPAGGTPHCSLEHIIGGFLCYAGWCVRVGQAQPRTAPDDVMFPLLSQAAVKLCSSCGCGREQTEWLWAWNDTIDRLAT
jgi:hypothetical protein